MRPRCSGCIPLGLCCTVPVAQAVRCALSAVRAVFPLSSRRCLRDAGGPRAAAQEPQGGPARGGGAAVEKAMPMARARVAQQQQQTQARACRRSRGCRARQCSSEKQLLRRVGEHVHVHLEPPPSLPITPPLLSRCRQLCNAFTFLHSARAKWGERTRLCHSKERAHTGGRTHSHNVYI